MEKTKAKETHGSQAERKQNEIAKVPLNFP